MKHDRFESEACWENLGLAASTIPDSGAPGPADSGSEDASDFAAYDISFRHPFSSSAGRAATERSLLQDVQHTEAQRRQGAEKRRKINPAHTDYSLCAANLLILWWRLKCTMVPHPRKLIVRNKVWLSSVLNKKAYLPILWPISVST